MALSRIAFVTSAGVVRRDDRPFDLQIEVEDPWWSDQSFRIIPDGTTTVDVRLQHLHIDCSFGEHDLDCVLPLSRLHELQQAGAIGSVAAHHYSVMGYVLVARELITVSAVEIAAKMRSEGVDVAVLVPV